MASQSYVPNVDAEHLSRGYGASSQPDVGVNDFANNHYGSSAPAERRGRFEESFDARTRGSSVLLDGDIPARSASRASRASTTLNQGSTPSRSGTLKKKGSIRRSGSRRSMHAGSIRGVAMDDQEHGYEREESVFYTPVPTKGSPTEVLADRFQTWRKFLKDLITYFREVSSSYEHRAKSLLKVSNVINNTNAPAALLTEGGLNDANRILRDFHKQAIVEANKARDIEADVINQLSGLRADLAQKIKEIKSLSGDFKNSVEKEKEVTRKCVTALEEALAVVDSDPSAIAGKGDPYVVRLGVERQVERQIDEENYLHRAYLNLENSGRELESIVVGEIQKAYNALASILKRDADEMYSTVDRLRSGPIAMPRDLEWIKFVKSDPHFVNPDLPLRKLEDIEYPGKHHPATAEVRAGMLERKSKYLKSYTPGWYVLSPTHIHEFKSADRIYTQPPVMSLYLPDQKLGSRSQPNSSSHKFVVKGRQTGSMHRGHTWVFRAETYETMLAWYDDIKVLTEKSGEERNAFVRRHASVRSTSAGSTRSGSSDGALDEDEADAIPYSANQSLANQPVREQTPRPSPGGRFPSDLNVNRNLQAPLSPSSGSSEFGQDITTAAGGPQDMQPMYLAGANHQQAFPVSYPTTQSPPIAESYPPQRHNYPVQSPPENAYTSAPQQYAPQPSHPAHAIVNRHDSDYGGWLGPAAGGAAAGAVAGYAGTQALHKHQIEQQERAEQEELDRQAEYQGAEASSTQQPATTAPIVLQRDPDHHAHPVPDEPPNTSAPGVHPSLFPAPVIASTSTREPADSRLDTTAMSPSTDASFLDEPEVGAAPFGAASGKTVNGGPVPVGLVDLADGQAYPSVRRTNTDTSVSDLHVPGEYPKAQGVKAAPALKEEDVVQM